MKHTKLQFRVFESGEKKKWTERRRRGVCAVAACRACSDRTSACLLSLVSFVFFLPSLFSAFLCFLLCFVERTNAVLTSSLLFVVWWWCGVRIASRTASDLTQFFFLPFLFRTRHLCACAHVCACVCADGCTQFKHLISNPNLPLSFSRSYFLLLLRSPAVASRSSLLELRGDADAQLKRMTQLENMTERGSMTVDGRGEDDPRQCPYVERG